MTEQPRQARDVGKSVRLMALARGWTRPLRCTWCRHVYDGNNRSHARQHVHCKKA